MTQLKIITTNRNKFKELSRALEGIAEVRWINLQIPESRDLDVVDVCKKKLWLAHKITGERNIVVEDRGFYINELNGFPGSMVNFVLKTIGVERLIKLVEKDRNCYFKYALGHLDDEGRMHFFTSVENGKLAENVRSGDDRGWGPLMNVFISPMFPDKTLSELNDDEWNQYKKIFERNNHMSKFVELIKENYF